MKTCGNFHTSLTSKENHNTSTDVDTEESHRHRCTFRRSLRRRTKCSLKIETEHWNLLLVLHSRQNENLEPAL